MQEVGQGPHNLLLTNELRLHCKSTSAKYKDFQEKQTIAADKHTEDAEIKYFIDQTGDVKRKEEELRSSWRVKGKEELVTY